MKFTIVTAGNRVAWKAERERIDLAAVVIRFLGPAPGRHGDRGCRHWWRCPFHQDRNPSFCVEPGKPWWRCFGCGEHGDAATLVMRMEGVSFPEAVSRLVGSYAPSGKPGSRPKPAPRPVARPTAPIAPNVMTAEAAAALVTEAAARLWAPEGSKALAYLTGPDRCLTPETIRAARLGWTPRADGVPWKPPGVVIPWYNGGRPALVKVRPLDGWRRRFPIDKRPPKYIEVYRDPALVALYPGPEAIRPGRPLVVVEGEFDALCLAQELGGLAAVVTLGSASARLTPAVLGKMLSAAPWFVATDEDEAGERAASRWPASARRTRPPGSFKDWTEAKAGGVDLARWWRDVLARIDRPSLFTWDDLSGWRWGPAGDDPTPGIVIDRPETDRQVIALRDDPEERAAIRAADYDEELQGLLRRLSDRGIRVDGALVHPTIAVGTVTGRVTYSEPGLQGVPKKDRLRRIAPVVEGRVFVRADYGQIEPRILLAILRRHGLISWDAGEDLYRDLIADASVNRETAKRAVNKVINGGRLGRVTMGRLAEFVRGTEAFRVSMAGEAKGRGYVETLAGRRIPLAARIWNHGGKAVNGVVQGTAADIFNRAAVAVDRAISEQGLSAAVAFLIFDELWVEADPDDERVVPLVRAEMEAAALADGVFVPVRFDEAVSTVTGRTNPHTEQPPT